LVTAPCLGQPVAAPEKYVTREEYEKLLKELETVKARLKATEDKGAAQQSETEEAFKDYDKELKSIKSLATSALPGNTRPLLTGYAFAGYTDRTGENGTFDAGFNPIFLWKLNDRLFFEGEMELELSRTATEVDLEYANLSYLAQAEGMVGVITDLGREIKGYAQTGLAMFQEILVAFVGICCSAKTGILPHRPKSPAVHCRLHTAGEWVLSRKSEISLVINSLYIERSKEPF